MTDRYSVRIGSEPAASKIHVEPLIWLWLREIAAERGIPLSHLMEEIDPVTDCKSMQMVLIAPLHCRARYVSSLRSILPLASFLHSITRLLAQNPNDKLGVTLPRATALSQPNATVLHLGHDS